MRTANGVSRENGLCADDARFLGLFEVDLEGVVEGFVRREVDVVDPQRGVDRRGRLSEFEYRSRGDRR